MRPVQSLDSAHTVAVAFGMSKPIAVFPTFPRFLLEQVSRSLHGRILFELSVVQDGCDMRPAPKLQGFLVIPTLAAGRHIVCPCVGSLWWLSCSSARLRRRVGPPLPTVCGSIHA